MNRSTRKKIITYCIHFIFSASFIPLVQTFYFFIAVLQKSWPTGLTVDSACVPAFVRKAATTYRGFPEENEIEVGNKNKTIYFQSPQYLREISF